MVKYIGAKANNELRRRGAKYNKPMTYEEIRKALFGALRNTRGDTGDVIDIQLSKEFIAMTSATTKRTQKDLVKTVSTLHDEYHLTFREIVMALNKVNFKDDNQRPERAREIADSLARKLNRYSREELGMPSVPMVTNKGIMSGIGKLTRRLHAKSAKLAVVLIPRIRKSMKSYPDDLRMLIEWQINDRGESWLISIIRKKTPKLKAVLSSDRTEVITGGETDILEFFDMYNMRVKGKNISQEMKDAMEWYLLEGV